MDVMMFIYLAVTVMLFVALLIEYLQATKTEREREEFPSLSDAALMILVWPGVAALLLFGLVLILVAHPPRD